MIWSTLGFRSSLVLLALFVSLISPRGKAFGVVGDVNFTGLPPNTTVTLTNLETGEEEEKETNDRGAVTFLWGGKNKSPGSYTVAARNSSMFPGKPSRRIQLTDGPNTIDLRSLVPFVGGIAIPRAGSQNILEFRVGTTVFDGAQPFAPSATLRVMYKPPIYTISFTPYVAFEVIPDLNVRSKNKPIDFNGVFQRKITGGYAMGVDVGIQHDLGTFDIFGLPLMADGYFGLGMMHYVLNLKDVNPPSADFQVADKFDPADGAFKFNMGLTLSVPVNKNFSAEAGVAISPQRTDIGNGGQKWVTPQNYFLGARLRF